MSGHTGFTELGNVLLHGPYQVESLQTSSINFLNGRLGQTVTTHLLTLTQITRVWHCQIVSTHKGLNRGSWQPGIPKFYYQCSQHMRLLIWLMAISTHRELRLTKFVFIIQTYTKMWLNFIVSSWQFKLISYISEILLFVRVLGKFVTELPVFFIFHMDGWFCYWDLGLLGLVWLSFSSSSLSSGLPQSSDNPGRHVWIWQFTFLYLFVTKLNKREVSFKFFIWCEKWYRIK